MLFFLFLFFELHIVDWSKVGWGVLFDYLQVEFDASNQLPN